MSIADGVLHCFLCWDWELGMDSGSRAWTLD